MATCTDSASEPWELYYWCSVQEDGKNHMIGRGEFVRLMFEVAGVPYIDHGMTADGSNKVLQFVKLVDVNKDYPKNNDYPAFAPPMIKKGDFTLSQTPTIMKFLGKKLGMYPTNEADEAHADALMAFLTDFVAEGRLAFHSTNFTMSYYKQKAETQPVVDWFEKERLQQFLSYLERCLAFNAKKNPGTDGAGGGYFIGKTMTYVDVAAFHVLSAAESQFPKAYTELTQQTTVGTAEAGGGTPLLAEFQARMAATPNLAQYLASERRGFFEGNSMM